MADPNQEAQEAREDQEDRQRLEACLHALDIGATDPEEEAGYFGPRSLTWRIFREPAMLIPGLAAVLLQLAHPDVAAGVDQASAFRNDLYGRARRTSAMFFRIVFGTREEARAVSRRLHQIHRGVRGPAFRANDPVLQRWVWATLVETAARFYEQVFAQFTAAEHRQRYEEALRVGVLLGMPLALLPPDLQAFDAYYRDTLASAELRVGPVAEDIAATLLRAPGMRHRPLGPFVAALTAGLLPPALRVAYGLRASDAAIGRSRRALRLLMRALPPPLRTVPAYYRAQARLWLRRGPRLIRAAG